ncbi:hypothetical protein EYF80_043900 [Liparis tanakae]|uniref:Uncharacterized protein n=1 Tax=Liparis tanakae TaxID=230148 RepID=A0A4Z2FYC9_9TELE|nr:hypothetical protein EYF80_043900 [Liparis tanakae]
MDLDSGLELPYIRETHFITQRNHGGRRRRPRSLHGKTSRERYGGFPRHRHRQAVSVPPAGSLSTRRHSCVRPASLARLDELLAELLAGDTSRVWCSEAVITVCGKRTQAASVTSSVGLRAHFGAS